MSQNELTLYTDLFDELTPSSTIDHVIAGIEKFKDHPNFAYDMITFGAIASKDYQTYYGIGEFSENSICVGCIATTTIFTIMEEEPTEDNIYLSHHPKNGYTPESVRELEYAINSLRCYEIRTYLSYFMEHKEEINFSLSHIEEIRQEFITLVGHPKDLPIMNGHPKRSQLDVFIRIIRDLQTILQNHNL